MNQRDVFIKELREGTIEVSVHNPLQEMFQNEVLRPILKLQNDLFIASFKNYSAKYNKDFNSQTTEKS
jgi:hypothetical protein